MAGGTGKRLAAMLAGSCAALALASNSAYAAELDLSRAGLLAVEDGEGTTRLAAELLSREQSSLGGRPASIVAEENA